MPGRAQSPFQSVGASVMLGATAPARGSDAVMISSSDLARLRATLAPPAATQAEAKRDTLKRMSEARVARWPNTLAAQRRAKEEARKRREEELEAARLAVDDEEEERRRGERRAAIERASHLLYSQTDRMKELASRKLHSDVLEERKVQLQEKQSRRTVERQRDEFWQAVQISEAQKLLRREQQEAQERKSKAADVAGMQRQQLEEYKQRYVEQLFAEKQEGERLLSQAQRAVQEEQEKLRQTRERAKNDQRIVRAQNERLQAMRAEERAAEEALLAKIEAEAAEKARLQELRRQAEVVKHQRKLERTQRMIDRAVKHLSELRNDEEARLERQIAEVEAKAADELQRREERRRRQQEAIDRSRRAQVDMRRRGREAEVAAGREFAHQWRLQQARIEEAEAEERRAQRERERDQAEFIRQQAEEKRLLREQERHADLYSAAKAQEALRLEDERFVAHVRGVVGEYERQGKNTIVVGRALEPRDELKLLPM